MKLESLLQYLDGYLGLPGHPDYPNALNGLQVAGRGTVRKVVAAVDASEAAIAAAGEAGADLLLVHHGLFWDGLRPVTGRRYRKLAALLKQRMALYSAHLPLDAHEEVGNCALLARSMGLEVSGRFGDFSGVRIGWEGVFRRALTPRGVLGRVSTAVGGGVVHHVAGGRERITRVGVVTGGGGSFVEEAAAAGLDALVTGEGAHHHHHDAVEEGIHLFLAGHYATETFGVQALAQHLAERFGLEWAFVDQPTGL